MTAERAVGDDKLLAFAAIMKAFARQQDKRVDQLIREEEQSDLDRMEQN